MKFFSLIFSAIFVALLLLSSNSFAQNVDISKNNPFVESSLDLLKLDDPVGQNIIAKSLLDKGVTDQRIYQQLVELINQYSASGDYKHLSWIAIGLGASGDVQYKPVLENLSKNGKGRSKKHAKRALKTLEKQSVINAIAVRDAYVGDSVILEKNEFVRNALAKLNSNEITFQNRAVKSLMNMGITEERVYARISELIMQYATDDDSGNDVQIARLVKGLAYSGDSTYRPFIEHLPEKSTKKIKKHIKKALKILTKQEVLNPILAKEDLYTGQESWQSIREANLILFSNDFKAIKDIAEQAIVYSKYNAFVFDAMNQRILSDYQIESDDKKKIDTYAYWTKAFVHFPSIEYLETLKLVSTSAGNKKLRKYSSTVLRRSGIRLAEVEELSNSVDYNGEEIGSVSIVFLDPNQVQLDKEKEKDTENLENWEKSENSTGFDDLASFNKMNLKAEILKNLQRNKKYNVSSENSLTIKVTSYRVFSRAARAAIAPIPLGADYLIADIQLGIKNQEQQNFTIRSLAASKFLNRNATGEAQLKKDFIIKLMSIFK